MKMNGIKYVTIYIKEKEFDEGRANAKKAAKENMGDDEYGKNLLMFENLNPSLEEISLEDGEIVLSLNTDIGDIYLNLPLTNDLEIEILQNAIKKFNKAKQFLENMKE